MAKGKKYTKISKEEWEAAKSLKAIGMVWRDIGATLDRDGKNLCSVFKKTDGDYDTYAERYVKGKVKRKTEQLQFIPPEVPKAPKKINVRQEISEDRWVAYKLNLARKQAIAVNNFIKELRDAGFRF